MTGVVLRCSNCGTVQAAESPCEACHEGPVRYYCTNHDPGRWLEGPSCGACGARFGEAPRPPRPAAASPPSPPSRAAPYRPTPAPDADGPWARDAPPPRFDTHSREAARGAAAAKRLLDLLSMASSAYGRAATRVRDEPRTGPNPRRGCLGRAVLILLALIGLLVLAPLLLLRLFLGGAL